MPIVDLRTNVAMPADAREELLRRVVQGVARTLDKPPGNVMVAHSSSDLFLDGSSAPAARVELRCVAGVPHEAARAACRELARLLRLALSIPPERVYLQVVDVPLTAAWSCTGDNAVSALEQRRVPGAIE